MSDDLAERFRAHGVTGTDAYWRRVKRAGAVIAGVSAVGLVAWTLAPVAVAPLLERGVYGLLLFGLVFGSAAYVGAGQMSFRGGGS